MNHLSGYQVAARLANQVLSHLHRDQEDGLEDLSFPPPRGHHTVRLCAITGKRATAACDRVSLEWLGPGQEPVNSCDAHIQMAVDTRDGSLASSKTPAEFWEVRTFVELPPLYAAWAAASGLPRPPREPSFFRTSGEARLSIPLLSGLGPEANVHITSPENGLRLMSDPETPADLSTLALRVVVDPPSSQVLWYVDEEPFQLVAYPYTTRWPLTPGEHTFQARLPTTDEASGKVRVLVQK